MKKRSHVPKPGPVACIVPGTTVLLGGQPADVVAIRGLERVHLRLHSNGRLVSSTPGELVLCNQLPPSEGALPHPSDTEAAAHARAVEWVRLLTGLPPVPSRQQQIDVANQMGVSRRAMQRRLERFRNDPSVTSQLDKPPGPLPGTGRLGTLQEEEIRTAIDELFLTRERPTILKVTELVRERCHQKGIAMPGYKAIRARILQEDRLNVTVRRLGADVAKAIQEPAIRSLRATGPLSDVQIDHAVCDVMVLSEHDREPLGRPWITIAIDVWTRCVLGYYLGLEVPNQTSVALCLEHALFPKGDWLSRIGERVSYPMYGVPQRIHWDNAKTFQTHAARIQLERYGIEARPRPIKRPHYGAYIERYIGTLMKAVHLIPGTTFSNTRTKGDYDSEARAIMTFAELERWMVQEIAGGYHNRRHRGLGKLTPSEAWRDAWKKDDGSFDLPPLIQDRDDFFIGLLPFRFRTVQRDGLHLHGLRYWDPSLTPLINSPEKYRVHYDQRDLSKVYLCWQDHFLQVPWLDRSQDPIALWELRDAVRVLALKHDPKSEYTVFKTAAAQRKIIDEATTLTKRARRSRSLRPAPLASAPQAPDYSQSAPVIPLGWSEVR